MKKHHKYSLLGLKALKRATEQAMKEAQLHSYKVPYWKEGKISVEVPELNSEQNAADRPGGLSSPLGIKNENI